MARHLQFTVSVPTDEGFLGRACNASDCGQYFKVHADDRTDRMHCPYCGEQFSQDELYTQDQLRHMKRAVEAEGAYYVQKELQKILKKTFGGASERRSGISYKPGKIRKKRVAPRYSERAVDTGLQCPSCDCRFQVYGLFGYCPSCAQSNLQVYDTNWAKIEAEVATTENPERALRHAYGDLVSAFEIFCNAKAKRLATTHPSFQVLSDARRFFRRQLSVNILEGISTSSLLALRRVFQKRHVYIHAGGEITERYVRMIPEDKLLLGKKAELNIGELQTAADAMRDALLRLIRALEARG